MFLYLHMSFTVFMSISTISLRAALFLSLTAAAPADAQYTATETVLLRTACIAQTTLDFTAAPCAELLVTDQGHLVADNPRLLPAETRDTFVAREETLCAEGSALNCARLGRIIFATDLYNPRHFDLLSVACDAGIGWACSALSDSADTLSYIPAKHVADRQRLREWYDALGPACETGDQTACVNRARLNPVLPVTRPTLDIAIGGLEAPCEDGHARACTVLSYLHGDGAYALQEVMPDFRPSQRKADRYARLACDGGNPSGCYNLGLSLEDNWELAHMRYTEACAGGEPEGCAELRWESYWQRGDPTGLLSNACRAGDFNACLYLAEKRAKPIRLDSDAPADKARLATYAEDLELICRMGSGTACGQYANLLSYTAPNLAREQAYATAGCEVLDGHACYVLAYGHETQDAWPMALNFYQTACDLEFWAGCAASGYLLETSKAAPADRDEAARYYQIGCNHRDARSCRNLSILLRDAAPAEAANLADRACALNTDYCP